VELNPGKDVERHPGKNAGQAQGPLSTHFGQTSDDAGQRGVSQHARHPLTQEAVAVRATGRSEVSGLEITRADGSRVKLPCDFVAVCLPPSPSFELAKQGGAEVQFDPEQGVFSVRADAVGRTHARDVYVAGEVTGPKSAAAAAHEGARVARALILEWRTAP
jgi:thioredoxin reductase